MLGTLKLNSCFKKDFLEGRKWLAKLIARHKEAQDEALEECLRYKARPAITAANEVARIKREKSSCRRERPSKVRTETIKEYFPIVEEYEQEILEETNGFLPMDLTDDSGVDRVRRFMSSEEYKNFRHQSVTNLPSIGFKTHKSELRRKIV